MVIDIVASSERGPSRSFVEGGVHAGPEVLDAGRRWERVLQHGPMVQSIGSIWSLSALTPYGGQTTDEDALEGWPQAPPS